MVINYLAHTHTKHDPSFKVKNIGLTPGGLVSVPRDASSSLAAEQPVRAIPESPLSPRSVAVEEHNTGDTGASKNVSSVVTEGLVPLVVVLVACAFCEAADKDRADWFVLRSSGTEAADIKVCIHPSVFVVVVVVEVF
jgi:hypothetical protein